MRRWIGNREVNAIGLGCMNVCHAYGAAIPEGDAQSLFERAIDAGYDHFDTARIYGAGQSELIVGRAIKARRKDIFLASKMGIFAEKGKRWIDCRPETIRAEVEKSLSALATDHIDLYYLHRPDFSTPIEDSAGALADLIREGKIGAYGLSEMNAETLRRAHAVAPVAAIQSEYSPMTRNPEIAVLDACAELGVTLVAFSPVGRGALTNRRLDPETFVRGDIRTSMPRFQPDHWPTNLALVERFSRIAADAGVTPAQLALGWVLARGDHVVAIPGTSNMAHLEENIARPDWLPDAALVSRVDAAINHQTVSGERYNAAAQATVSTEEFA